MKVGDILARSIANLDWLRFLRGRLRLLLAWLLLVLLAGVVGWMLLLEDLDKERKHAEDEALRAAMSLSKVYAGHLAQTVGAIDQLMLHVRYEWELSEGLLPLESIRETGIFPPLGQLFVAISDSDGTLLTSTIPQSSTVKLADRQYFQVQRNALRDALYIGEPTVGRLSNVNVVPFSRRLLDKAGGFSGAVLASVSADYFTVTYDETVLGSFGFLGFIGDDGVMRVARVGESVYQPDAQALVAVPDFGAGPGSTLLDGKQWFTDQRSRYIGWHAVPDYPLVALAGLDQQDALARFHAERTATLRDATWATVGLAVFTLTAMVFSLRLAWSKFQTELTQATYRMATEEGNEGFYIVQPVADKNGAIVDFETIDCNHQGAAFFGVQRHQAIGRRLSSFYFGEDFERVMGRLMQAMHTGVYDSEIEVPANAPVRTRWLHLKIVRSNGHLAIRLRDLTDTKAHFEALERRGNEDALTGLPNRHWVNAYLPTAIGHAQQHGTMLALLFIDLDGFKAVNDTMGHEAGDELLRTAGRRLQEAVRPHDHVVRIGGDEFVVILEGIVQKIDAAHVAERVLHAFQASFRLSQGIASVGT
ncbi:MAG: diguanylate cyclase domain-containing protein, partial [Noviherbaspirillum sp.]